MTSELHSMTKRQLQAALKLARRYLEDARSHVDDIRKDFQNEAAGHQEERLQRQQFERENNDLVRRIETIKTKVEQLEDAFRSKDEVIRVLTQSNIALTERCEKADGRIGQLLAIADNAAVAVARLTERL